MELECWNRITCTIFEYDFSFDKFRHIVMCCCKEVPIITSFQLHEHSTSSYNLTALAMQWVQSRNRCMQRLQGLTSEMTDGNLIPCSQT